MNYPTRTTLCHLSLSAAFALGCSFLLPAVMHSQATPATQSPGNQASTPASGCTLTGKVYNCDLRVFRRVLRSAQTVTTEVAPQDAPAQKQLDELAEKLHKTVAPKGQADLYLVLLPFDNAGVTFGPADSDLATLRVYARDAEGARGQLLWSEVYRGQADRPWGLIVHALIQQFEERLHTRG